MAFRKLPTEIEGLLIIEPDVFGDNRGYFMETYNKAAFESLGITEQFVQDNLSFSKMGILRGLHFQKTPHAQGKLVTVLQGEAFDVAVDLRNGSATYGKHVGVHLSEENHRMFFVPKGFAHGFVVLSETCLFAYKCSHSYDKDSEGGLMWNDPSLGIKWPEPNPVVSEKDSYYTPFSEFSSPFQL